MSNLPLVSVIIVTYNHEEYIKDCLDSVLSQTYENIEVIIGDDASTDNTRGIIESYQGKYPEIIKPVYHLQNVGIPKNINSVLSKVTGEYIAFLAGDDLYKPEKLDRQVRFLTENPEYIGCYSKHEAFDSSTGEVFYTSNPQGRMLKGGFEIFKNGNFYADIKDIMFKRAFSEPFNEDFVYYNDTLFMTLLAEKGKLGYIDEVYYGYRIHRESVTAKNYNNPQFLMEEKLKLYQLLKEKTNPPLMYYNMACSREYCDTAAWIMLFGRELPLATSYLSISKTYYKAGLCESIYCFVTYKTPSLLVQKLLTVTMALRVNFLLRFAYRVYKMFKGTGRNI